MNTCSNQFNTEKPQVIRIQDLKVFLKGARRVLKEKQRIGVVGSVDEDRLAKKYTIDLKAFSKEIRRLTQIEKDQSGSVVSKITYFLFPSYKYDITSQLSRVWDNVAKICRAFITTSEHRNISLANYAFRPGQDRFLSLAIPTSTAVNYFADQLGFRVSQHRSDAIHEEQADDTKTLTLTFPNIAKIWWNEEDRNQYDLNDFDLNDQLNRAARKVIFMMDELGPFPLCRLLNEIQDMLEETIKLLVLLTRFSAIPEASEIIEFQLEKMVSLLYHIYTLICSVQCRVPDNNKILLSRFKTLQFSFGFVEAPEEHLSFLRTCLNSIVAEALDRRAEHWRLLTTQEPPISVASLISNPSEYLGDALSQIFTSSNGIQDLGLGDILFDQDRETLERLNQLQTDGREVDSSTEPDFDQVIIELNRLGLPHIIISQSTLKSRPIARGGNGRVYKTRVILDNYFRDDVVVKVPDTGKDNWERTRIKGILNEARIWNSLQISARRDPEYHERPPIVPFLGYSLIAGFPYPGLVSPYLSKGCLQAYVQGTDLSFSERLNLLLDVIQALRFMHSESYVHADLKAANILIDDSGHAVLSDFGASIELPNFSYARQQASYEWLAPELLNVQGGSILRLSCQSDIYAYGVVCVEVMTGRVPSREEQDSVLIAERSNERRPPIDNMDDVLWQLTITCWRLNPETRPEASSIIARLKLFLD